MTAAWAAALIAFAGLGLGVFWKVVTLAKELGSLSQRVIHIEDDNRDDKTSRKGMYDKINTMAQDIAVIKGKFEGVPK